MFTFNNFKKKTIKIKSRHGKETEVSHTQKVTRDSLHFLQIEARCGASTHQKTLTIGTVDGKRPTPPTKEELQAMLDQYRQECADHASWKESVREAMEGVE